VDGKKCENKAKGKNKELREQKNIIGESKTERSLQSLLRVGKWSHTHGVNKIWMFFILVLHFFLLLSC